MSKIVCVGSMNMDIAAYSTTLPRPGETVFGSTLLSSPGGKGLNQAVSARRLGADVAFFGMLGGDNAGNRLAAFLDAEGIDTSGIARIDHVPTGTAIILVDARSENAIVVIPGANMAWPPGALDAMQLSAGDIVIAQFEVPEAVIVAAFEKARQAGARTILNAAPARVMSPELLTLCDILIVNETELATVSAKAIDCDDIAAVSAAALQLSGPSLAVVATLGSAGAVVATSGAMSRVEGSAVAAVDTSGAGDCFVGALAAALARGETLSNAAAFANRAAGISVTRKGTAISMPFAHELGVTS
jgi:ribokinase